MSSPAEKLTQFESLLAEHRRGIYGHILSLVPNRNDADDVHQETCVTLWQKHDQYQPGTDFRAWACRIAYYKVLKLRERQVKSPRLFSPDVMEQIDEESIVMSDALDRRSEALANCREKLPARDQELLGRYYKEGATTRRVASHLRWSTDKLYRAIRRIHDVLYDCVNQALKEQPND